MSDEHQVPPRRKRAFISHASEDKPFVKNLTDTLMGYGVTVWYDDYEIKVGDSIRASINDGLNESAYGVVVLSPSFFAKKWPKRELAALAGLLDDGRVLPVFYNITPAEVADADPLLADVKGLVSRPEDDVRLVVAPIAEKILGPDEHDGDGHAIYRFKTVKVSELALSYRQCIENTVFEDCVIQGITMFTPVEAMEFTDCVFEGPHTFLPMEPRVHSGTIGLRHVHFRRCRFKDIGFIVAPDTYAKFMEAEPTPEGFTFPAHLQ